MVDQALRTYFYICGDEIRATIENMRVLFRSVLFYTGIIDTADSHWSTPDGEFSFSIKGHKFILDLFELNVLEEKFSFQDIYILFARQFQNWLKENYDTCFGIMECSYTFSEDGRVVIKPLTKVN